MQDLTLTFTSTRERRTSDDTLRDQLSFIAKRALAGNRGRGWDFEVDTISDEKGSRNGGGAEYKLTANIKFFRRVEIDSDRFIHQSSEITEWAAAAGHKFGKRPWVLDLKNSKALPQVSDDETATDRECRLDSEVVPLREVGIIKPKDYYSHLYDLDSQISVLLSSIQAAADSDMRNRFHALLNGLPGCGKTEILLATARLLDDLGVFYVKMDATSTTEAGVRKNFLDESAPIPEVILIEEVEKVVDNAMRWLLGVMDPRAEISQTNYRRTATRKVPALVLSTANDMIQLGKMMYGAFRSRYQMEIYCPRPSRETLGKILHREIVKVSGSDSWIEPTLSFMYDQIGETDPRKIIPVCLCGKEKLISGVYQKDLMKTMKLENKPASLTAQEADDL